MKTFNYQARQGDLLIEKTAPLPKTLKKSKTDVLATGDSTNFAHRIVGGQILLDRKGDMYLSVPKEGTLVHEGHHKPIALKKGKYKVIRQRETTMGDMTRLVQD